MNSFDKNGRFNEVLNHKYKISYRVTSIHFKPELFKLCIVTRSRAIE